MEDDEKGNSLAYRNLKRNSKSRPLEVGVVRYQILKVTVRCTLTEWEKYSG